MANRLVSVDDNLNLPPAVQEQLVGNVRQEFIAYSTAAQNAASSAAQDAVTADLAADRAELSATVITEVSATELPPGSEPTVTMGGTTNGRTLEFGIPEGLPGGPPSLSGTLAARPAADSVPTSTLYFVTDVPEIHRSNGTAWQVVGGGNEVGYAQSTTAFNTTSTSAVDVTGLTVTFVAGNRPLRIDFNAEMRCSSATGIVVAYLTLDGTTLAGAGINTVPANIPQQIARSARIPAQTPGTTHVAKIRVAVGGAYTGYIQGQANNPAFIQVVTV